MFGSEVRSQDYQNPVGVICVVGQCDHKPGQAVCQLPITGHYQRAVDVLLAPELINVFTAHPLFYVPDIVRIGCENGASQNIA